MFTLIGSLILIFKELRFIRSEGLKVYLNFPALSREILIFLSQEVFENTTLS